MSVRRGLARWTRRTDFTHLAREEDMAKTFVLEKGTGKDKHTVRTTVATEAMQLRAHGYRQVDDKPTPKPAENPTK